MIRSDFLLVTRLPSKLERREAKPEVNAWRSRLRHASPRRSMARAFICRPAPCRRLAHRQPPSQESREAVVSFLHGPETTTSGLPPETRPKESLP
ncbi:hypothetical protein HPB47_008105 [Ixodes persulcatus]|uniref:Uncharacterized protein n=1 Tax=Ixodes persulcatus TaxID=34615 RepID=A0AC60P5Y9_IXOPE|nr:hypothetical protein HPB47_008105 [Ixodes persulcatus]